MDHTPLASVDPGARLDASVVVATSNRSRLVRRCVECLCRQDYPRTQYEVIVVDDGSTDDTRERLQPLADEGQIRYLRRTERTGAGPARNAGIGIAKGAIVIFVDSDAFAPPSFVAAHVAAHAAAPRAVVDGPAINVRSASVDHPPPFGSVRIRTLAALGFFGRPFVTVNASCSRKALDDAGGFDEAFGAQYGWEDTDLYLRLRAHGLRRVRARRAWLLHMADMTRDLVERGQRRFECGANAARLYANHRSSRTLGLIDGHALSRAAWLRHAGLTADRVERLCFSGGAGGWRYQLLARAYLTHKYAEGLRAGNWEAADAPMAALG